MATCHADEPEPCRACGHCPTCGRGGVFDGTWPVPPVYYYPYWQVPYWQPIISTSDTTFTAAVN